MVIKKLINLVASMAIMFGDKCSGVARNKRLGKWGRVRAGRVDFYQKCNKTLYGRRNVLTLANSFDRWCNWISASVR